MARTGDLEWSTSQGSLSASKRSLGTLHSSFFKNCRLMEYIVTEGDLSKAAGTIKYKDCKYNNGQKLVGDTGNCKAQKTEDIENDVSKEDTDTGEDVYEYDH